MQPSIGENACETERAEDARRCRRAFGLGCGPDTDGGTEEKKREKAVDTRQRSENRILRNTHF